MHSCIFNLVGFYHNSFSVGADTLWSGRQHEVAPAEEDKLLIHSCKFCVTEAWIDVTD